MSGERPAVCNVSTGLPKKVTFIFSSHDFARSTSPFLPNAEITELYIFGPQTPSDGGGRTSRSGCRPAFSIAIRCCAASSGRPSRPQIAIHWVVSFLFGSPFFCCTWRSTHDTLQCIHRQRNQQYEAGRTDCEDRCTVRCLESFLAVGPLQYSRRR
jgi:hypothetical protein